MAQRLDEETSVRSPGYVLAPRLDRHLWYVGPALLAVVFAVFVLGFFAAASSLAVDADTKARLDALRPLMLVLIVVGVPAALLVRLVARVPQAWMPLAAGLAIGLLASGR